MFSSRLAVVILGVCALVGCGSEEPADVNANIANIANVANVRSDFDGQFTVSNTAPTGIDPKLLGSPPLPNGLRFDPADCSKFATAQTLPAGLKGNLAAVTAEGNGNRFIVMAVETSEAVPVVDPGEACRQVTFTGGALRGLVEVVDVPQIDGATTVGIHRVLQTQVGGQARTGELYNYVAKFGNYQVIVTANPLIPPDKPPVPVDTAQARNLLVAAVAAVRG